MDFRPEAERQIQLVVARLHDEVLVEDFLLERHRSGPGLRIIPEVVPPERRVHAAPLLGLGLDEEPDDVAPAGLEELEPQAEGERRLVAVRHPPRLHQRSGTRFDCGVLAIGEGVLVDDPEPPTVALHLVGSQDGGLVGAERAGVDEWEVGEVEEVVSHEAGAGPRLGRRQLEALDSCRVASGMDGRSTSGASGAMKTRPKRSHSPAGDRRRAAGGRAAPGPRAGISTQLPASSKHHP